jgi:hypothetical protein
VRGLDPQVHRVQADDARIRALLAHLALQVGLDVGQEDHVRRPGRPRQLGLPVGEHVELRVVGVAGVEVVLVLARPEEGLAARDVLDVVDVDAARAQHVVLGLAEVVAHRAHHTHVGEEGC